jgi:hypothetical protein
MLPLPKTATLTDFSPDSRVWVYVCDRALTNEQAAHIQQELDFFCRQWTAHNQALKAVGEVFEGQMLILMVDETQAEASGCSIDKSVHFLEQLGDAMQVNFFERMRFAWLGQNGTLHFANRSELISALGAGQVTENTLMANTMVKTKQELQEKWLLPFQQSWHRRLAVTV